MSLLAARVPLVAGGCDGAGPDGGRRRAAAGAASPPRFEGLDRVPLEYANLINVAFDAYAFRLAFARLLAPTVWTNEEAAATFEQGLSATVVSQMIVAPNALRDFAQVVQAPLKNYEAAHGPIQPSRSTDATDAGASNGG